MTDSLSIGLLMLCATTLGCSGGGAAPVANAPPAADTTAVASDAANAGSEASPEPDASPDSEAGAEPTPSAVASAEPATPPPPPVVEVGKPSFVGDGTVPKVEAFLEKTRDEVARCVVEHGGLSSDSGELKVQFLVRLRGKAEGVDVMSSEGVSEDAERCVRDMLRGKAVATPTADPVGVQFRYRLKRAEP